MMRKLCALAAAVSVVTAVPLAHGGHDDDDRFGGIGSFRPVATFSVPGATSAEIVSATRDGKYLVYSDAIGRQFGLVDIRNPRQPQQVAVLDALGDPTSVAVLPVGNLAVGCVQPGKLILIDLTTFTKVAERTIGEGPDSVAVTRIAGQLVAVIAIENEGALGKGYVEVVRLNLADFANSPSATVTFNDESALAAAGLLAVADPQPEFVSIQGHEGGGHAARKQWHRDHRHQQSRSADARRVVLGRRDRKQTSRPARRCAHLVHRHVSGGQAGVGAGGRCENPGRNRVECGRLHALHS